MRFATNLRSAKSSSKTPKTACAGNGNSRSASIRLRQLMAFRPRSRGLFRIRYAFIALIAAILFGTIGFHLIEGWTFGESLYVTVQTLTTVGYGDIPPRGAFGRGFAVVVML